MLELFKNNNVKTDKLSLVLPLVLFVLYLIWSALLPISKAPDEIARIQVPFFIIQNGYLPSGWEESIRNPIWGISYAFTTYGASLIALPFIKFASFFTDDVGTMIFAARIPSCMFGALTVAVLMETSKLLNFNEKSRFLIGTTLGLLPQFAFLSSYHNQDIFSVFCASLVLLCWVLAIRDGLSVKLCVYWGLSLGLLSLSYYFAYSFIPLSIIFFCVIARWQQIPIKQATKYALLIFAVAFAIAGWFFIRNAIIYDGDIFGRSAYYQSAELFAMDEYRPSVLKTPQMEGKSLLDILFSREWFWSTFKSSISVLGYMQYALPKWVYVICLGLVCTSILVSLKTSLINNLKKGGG